MKSYSDVVCTIIGNEVEKILQNNFADKNMKYQLDYSLSTNTIICSIKNNNDSGVLAYHIEKMLDDHNHNVRFKFPDEL